MHGKPDVVRVERGSVNTGKVVLSAGTSVSVTFNDNSVVPNL